MIFWIRPYHLSAAEAEASARHEVGRLLTIEGVRSAELTRLGNASSRHTRDWDWMLELHLAAGVDGQACVDDKACAEWLGDLRLLGMRPSVLLAAGGTTVPLEAD